MAYLRHEGRAVDFVSAISNSVLTLAALIFVENTDKVADAGTKEGVYAHVKGS